MGQRSTYTRQQKAEAIAAFFTGESITSVAARMGVPFSTAAGWKNSANTAADVIGEQQKDELGELVTEYVREGLSTLRLQAREFSQHGWLERQNAADVAILHGVLADKITRVLSAIHALE